MAANENNSRSKPLTIITTHVNADFDAVGSLLAAHKLYPGSIVVFPGFHEKSAKNFFIHSMAYLFNMVDIREIDKERIGRLVIVDTKQKNRIGELAEQVGRQNVEIHIYDHHPSLATDIKPDVEVNRPTGANVTLLTEIIREKGIEISPEEATIMCLGIYEDTGGFMFSSTTENDFVAAGFLLSKGASLATIANFISKEMDPRQIRLLTDMIDSVGHHLINGVDIAITSVTCDEYIHDFAFLVQKMVKIENLNAIFAIALMKNKIYITARSRIPEVDAGAVIREMGGGGHSYAAAATIKDKTLAQTEQFLIELLHHHVKSRQWAKDIMSSPPITSEPGISCRKARQLLTRYNINALLVAEREDGEERLLGFVTRQVIEKALYHELDEIPIREYMTSEFAVVGPDAGIKEIQEKIIENKQRVLPVLEDGRILGVITRTDLLNTLVQESQNKQLQPFDPMVESAGPRRKNVAGFMNERLSARIMAMLKKIGIVAEELGYSAYVVGGFVRDMFLYRENEDIDIVIEGNGIEFAREFARRSDARINAYAKFSTAVIVFPDDFKIDVASARMEYYKFPAALPTVEMSSIKLDLFRRDFTINTLAIALNPGRFGQLIDFFGGQRDIKEKAIRILHNLSFVEDPTRVFRAARFEQRFGFTIGKLTSSLIENAVKMDFFKRLSGRRVLSELSQILKEENPTPALIRLNEYGLLRVIDPSLTLTNKLIDQFNNTRKVLSWYDLLFTEETCMKWVVYFLVLMHHAGREQTEEICRRFELAPKYRKIFIQERLSAEVRLNGLYRKLPLQNSGLYHQLKEFRIELILYIMAISEHRKIIRAISHYVTDLREIRLSVSGRDLKALGIPPSPVYGKVLSEILDAKLNGEVKNPREELEYLKKAAERHVKRLKTEG